MYWMLAWDEVEGFLDVMRSVCKSKEKRALNASKVEDCVCR